MGSKVDVYVVFSVQLALFILFCIFSVYDQKYEEQKYAMFQDVHVMIFVGFGFLMTFLRRYGYSAVGFNFLLGSLMLQWAILCQGFYKLDVNYKIPIGMPSLFDADIATAAVLISMGALLGRTSPVQLIVMGIVEIALFSVNLYIGSKIFKVADVGGSIFVHTFGAYFGLAVSYVLHKATNQPANSENSLNGATYTSDLFAMIGTIFLWLFWPSFNAIEVSGEEQQRAVINTYLSLAACCSTTYVMSLLLNDFKFDMVHIQNSTLAGGVAVGTSANLMLQPYGAVIVGMLAAIISVFGYAKITPFIEKHLAIPDTCGVHNLHGMPGVLAAIVGAVMASIATESMYFTSEIGHPNNTTLYDIYPARADMLSHKEGRTSGQQALYQIIALVTTLAIAIVSGLCTGLILTWKTSRPLKQKYFYDDHHEWQVPEDATVKTVAPYYIKSYPASMNVMKF